MTARVSIGIHTGERPIELRIGRLGGAARTLRLTRAEAEAAMSLLADALATDSAAPAADLVLGPAQLYRGVLIGGAA